MEKDRNTKVGKIWLKKFSSALDGMLVLIVQQLNKFIF